MASPAASVLPADRARLPGDLGDVLLDVLAACLPALLLMRRHGGDDDLLDAACANHAGQRRIVARDAVDALDKSFAGADTSQFRLDMGFDLHFGDFMFDAWTSLLYVTAFTAVFVVIAVIRMKRN